MTGHLDHDRISLSVLGEATDADRAHLGACPVCRAEVEQFEQALRGVRGSVREWGDREFAIASAAPKPLYRPTLTAGSMAVIALLALLAVRFPTSRTAPAPAVASDYAVSDYNDAELMAQVSADLARPVPKGLEVLLPR